MKTFTSHLRIVHYNYLVCEFTAHYACRNAKMNLKSTTTNRFTFPKIISLRKYLAGSGSGGGGGGGRGAGGGGGGGGGGPDGDS